MSYKKLAKEIEEICVYSQCFECGSVHRMNYDGNEFECEECYRRININDIDKDCILFDTHAIYKFIMSKKSNSKRYLIAWYIHCNGENDTEIYNPEFVEILYNFMIKNKSLDMAPDNLAGVPL